MIRLLTGTSRHEADPFHSICWMPCEMCPEGSNAIAVTKPHSARRRVSDLAELVYKQANFAGMARADVDRISSSMFRRAGRPKNTRTVSVRNNLKLELSKPARLLSRLVLNASIYVLLRLALRLAASSDGPEAFPSLLNRKRHAYLIGTVASSPDSHPTRVEGNSIRGVRSLQARPGRRCRRS
jgi:hypothetical protein